MDVVILLAGICGSLVIVILLVAAARVFNMRRRVAALQKVNDVQGLGDMAMNSESAMIRSGAVEALGRLSSFDVMEPLVQALRREREPAVRLLILETITSFGQSSAGPLLRSWEGLAVEERAGATLSLKRLGHESLVEALAMVAQEDPGLMNPFWETSDEMLRTAALEAILSLAGAAVEPLFALWDKLDPGEQQRVERELVAVGPPVVEPLTGLLNARPQLAEVAARLLSRIDILYDGGSEASTPPGENGADPGPDSQEDD